MFTLYQFYGDRKTDFTPIAKFETEDRNIAEEKMLENLETIFLEEVKMVEWGRKEVKAGRCSPSFIRLFGQKESETEGVFEKIKRKYTTPGSFLQKVENGWKKDILRVRCYVLVENDNFPVEVLRRLDIVESRKCITF